MHSIVGRNVNGIFAEAMHTLLAHGERERSRNGPVTVFPEPVCVSYARPCERVLFSPARRANPWFHLFESMWMLAGRNDAAFLNRYVRDFGERFAEPDTGMLWGAYGHRWRHWDDMDGGEIDQIEWAIDLLLREPTSRRAVIQMYDPSMDSAVVGVVPPKDIPCNTQIYLRIHPAVRAVVGKQQHIDASLDLTVCCRSNDAIWGAFGANAVHFSVLLEYLAWRLDVSVGRLHVLSNNLHVYENTQHLYNPLEPDHDLYEQEEVVAESLFSGCEPLIFNGELTCWFDDPSNKRLRSWECPIFQDLLIPMSIVHDLVCEKQWKLALGFCCKVRNTDWRRAAEMWIQGRKQ